MCGQKWERKKKKLEEEGWEGEKKKTKEIFSSFFPNDVRDLRWTVLEWEIQKREVPDRCGEY